jgi:hypothetical protein
MKFYLACTVLTKRKWERSQVYKVQTTFYTSEEKYNSIPKDYGP